MIQEKVVIKWLFYVLAVSVLSCLSKHIKICERATYTTVLSSNRDEHEEESLNVLCSSCSDKSPKRVQSDEPDCQNSRLT